MKALYFHTGSSSFVDKDERIFQEMGPVRSFAFTVKSKSQTPIVFLKQFVFLLKNFTSASIYISQFAGYHSFLPGLFAKFTGRPFLLISGGTDCVSYPGIRYGNFFKKALGVFTTWSYQLSTHLAPKHESLWMHQYTYDQTEPTLQGIKAFIPTLNIPHTAIPNGYDSTKWHKTKPKKENSFITVSGGFEFPFQIALKGIDLILAVAPHFPDCTFTIVGVPESKKLSIASTNIIVLPPTKNDALIDIFSEQQFYLQLSMAEGFPNALCEAMLCECVPIVSSVFSMPEIVGDAGFILKEKDLDQLKDLISQALESDIEQRGVLARQNIANNYSLGNRTERLTELINDMLSKPSNK